MQIIISFFLIIIIISIYFLVMDILQSKKTRDSNIKLIKKVIKDDEEVEKINWEELEKINQDIIGWIKIQNTNINYPILKDDQKLKYLKHSFDGKYNKNGSIFTLENKPFQEYETIIYGHNMKNEMMFSQLNKYLEEEFFKQNCIIYLYTKNQNYKATVFSCYSIGIDIEENNIKLLNFKDRLEYYKNSSLYSNKNIGEIKKIIKLSTCSYLNNHKTPTDQRYYIIAKLETVD